MLIGVEVLAFLAGALLVIGLTMPSTARGAVAERLEQIAGREERPMRQTAGPAGRTWWRERAAALGQATDFGRSPQARALLERAGNPRGMGAAEFAGLRALSSVTFLALTPVAAHLWGTSPLQKMVVIVLDMFIGVALPDAWLQRKIGARQAQIRKRLPDTLDLLVVSAEAGVAFDGAVAQVSEKMAGPLSEELRRALQEMRLGRTRGEALRAMATRAGVPEVTSFVAAVTQADRLGTGVSSVLRVQSEMARTQRMQRSRETAAKLPTKMLFPLVFFLFPALFVVLLGPGVINLLEALGAH